MEATIYITYQFESTAYDATNNFGYTTPIHCNYIKKLTTEDYNNSRAISVSFSNQDDFKFLVNALNELQGEGYSANRLNILVNVVEGIDEPPVLDDWKIINVTSQIDNHTVGNLIDRVNLETSIFTVKKSDVDSAVTYDLSYLDYPSSLEADDDRLAWGEESYFFGTVRADIKAKAFTTDIAVTLPLNEFNESTNPTWDETKDVYISEVGIYDDNNDLVAIGKINSPIKKNNTISRTIGFQIDF